MSQESITSLMYVRSLFSAEVLFSALAFTILLFNCRNFWRSNFCCLATISVIAKSPSEMILSKISFALFRFFVWFDDELKRRIWVWSVFPSFSLMSRPIYCSCLFFAPCALGNLLKSSIAARKFGLSRSLSRSVSYTHLTLPTKA